MTPWIVRGICVRSHNVDEVCYPTLLAVLNNLNELRKSEYSGAAGVLSLLPTIGALLGAPTNEIWTLLSILPFGGGLAMALSFGGAIMPVRVEDYERVMTKRNIAIGSIVTFRTPEGARHGSPEQRLSRLSLLEEMIKTRIEQPKSMMPNKSFPS
ncbi:hypothetical protein DBV05_g12507 [Lasiodiplodia theobromae]|uniref:Uncharacterized protein n=1 Tax=Lasiodiplodia theobromae TaxID=45133 RepID=A0A5N5CU09_9PEZI|nr:hypothetical protein DBV05_g12507 [Lasiodiplodia theobromae]